MRRSFFLCVLAVGCGSTGSGPTEPTTPITKDEAAAASEGAADSGIDYCARYGWYDDAECDGFCVLPDPDCGGEAARCFDGAGLAVDERAGCCELADYAYCADEGALARVDGEGPTFCAAIQGNGPRITAHFAALARIYEHYGLLDGVAGGSSGSISAFLVESVQMSPSVRSARTPAEKGLYASLLFKSLYGYFGALLEGGEGLAISELMELAARIRERDLEALLRDDPAAGVEALQTLLQSEDLRELIEPEALQLLAESPSPEFHARELMQAVQGLGSFTATDPVIFVRPGVISFRAFAAKVARVGSFYAGYAPADGAAMDAWLGDCAPRSRGRDWEAVAALETSEGTCGERFGALVADFRATLRGNEDAYPSRGDDPIGAHLPALVTTGVLEGAAVTTFERARDDYRAARPITWDVDFSDVYVGYFGAEDDLARVASNPRGYSDLKTRKHRSLGALRWAEVLSYSPAEPGLTRALELPGGGVSVGGWSDLQPTLVLKNLGCEKVVFVTRFGGAGGFLTEIATLLGIDAEESAALFDLTTPGASFRESVAEAAGVWCTDWDAPSIADLPAMFASGYEAPLETRDPWLRAADAYAGITERTGLPGCTLDVPR
jgi:hypothetical protein